MGCGCKKQSDNGKKLDNIRELAKAFAKSVGKTMVIYRIIDGFAFMDADCPEAKDVARIEFIYPA